MSLWYRLLKPAMTKFRTARARRIKAIFPNIADMDVVDLGGSLHFWELVSSELQPKSVTILNIAADGQALGYQRNRSERKKIILYDGKKIPFGDSEVDLLICNSVIEHVPLGEREGLAHEIERVSRNYLVQTPAYEFPIEPHFVAPFIHWLPRRVGRALAAFTPFALLVKETSGKTFFDEIHLLTRREFHRLFPGGELVTERMAGLPKSYLIFRRGARSAS